MDYIPDLAALSYLAAGGDGVAVAMLEALQAAQTAPVQSTVDHGNGQGLAPSPVDQSGLSPLAQNLQTATASTAQKQAPAAATAAATAATAAATAAGGTAVPSGDVAIGPAPPPSLFPKETQSTAAVAVPPPRLDGSGSSTVINGVTYNWDKQTVQRDGNVVQTGSDSNGNRYSYSLNQRDPKEHIITNLKNGQTNVVKTETDEYGKPVMNFSYSSPDSKGNVKISSSQSDKNRNNYVYNYVNGTNGEMDWTKQIGRTTQVYKAIGYFTDSSGKSLSSVMQYKGDPHIIENWIPQHATPDQYNASTQAYWNDAWQNFWFIDEYGHDPWASHASG